MRKSIVVTGGSSGIGRAIANRLLKGGHRVFILSRQAESSDLAKEEFCHAYNVDLTHTQAIQALAPEIAGLTENGGIDILVNCAGIGYGTPLKTLDEATFDQFMNINVKAVFFATQSFLRFMGKGGVICNISSIAGIRGFTEWSTYCASKFAIEGFSKALRDEVRGQGIRVMVVRPGAVDTPLYHFVDEGEKQDFMQAESIAEMVTPALFLDSKACVEELFINNSVGDI